jgi:hypothetical protein
MPLPTPLDSSLSLSQSGWVGMDHPSRNARRQGTETLDGADGVRLSLAGARCFPTPGSQDTPESGVMWVWMCWPVAVTMLGDAVDVVIAPPTVRRRKTDRMNFEQTQADSSKCSDDQFPRSVHAATQLRRNWVCGGSGGVSSNGSHTPDAYPIRTHHDRTIADGSPGDVRERGGQRRGAVVGPLAAGACIGAR